VCYTDTMTINRHIWRVWAENLHRWGVQGIVAAFLEAAGPMNVLGAQAVYLSQPLLSPLVSNDSIEALAALLEDKAQTHEFTTLLREGDRS
jgi:hypothetical protein